jgi:hypothetical protein
MSVPPRRSDGARKSGSADPAAHSRLNGGHTVDDRDPPPRRSRHHTGPSQHDPPRPVQRLPARDRSDPLVPLHSRPLMAGQPCRPRLRAVGISNASPTGDAHTPRRADPPVRRGRDPQATPARTVRAHRPAKIDNDSPNGAVRSGRLRGRRRASKLRRAFFRSKQVRRTQRRSDGLLGGLEDRTLDDEAPADQTPPPSRSGSRHGNRPGRIRQPPSTDDAKAYVASTFST